MFIKLTRLDNSPVWLNAAYVVTIEPQRHGAGSVVVPIGDGFDYDVKETPEQVLAMLADEPEPTVVPVPSPTGLAPTPTDVSPDPDCDADIPEAETPPPEPVPEPVPAPKVKPAARKTRAVRRPRAPKLSLTDEQLARLRKMAPGSVQKLQNTLVTQFKVADAAAVLKALEAKKLLSLDRERVLWTAVRESES